MFTIKVQQVKRDDDGRVLAGGDVVYERDGLSDLLFAIETREGLYDRVFPRKTHTIHIDKETD